jgi:membrane protein DedA with SNARE-associated domain
VLQQIIDFVQHIVRDMGYPGLFVLIMLESTLIPIPSELIMPFAGYLAHTGEFSLPVILVINSAAALVGSGICYWIGVAGGKPLLVKYGKFMGVRKKDIERTETYFARHGKATIFIARFLPVVRHIISVPAGIARMPLPPFFLQTFLGASIWGTVLMMIGYELGNWAVIAEKLKHVDLLVGVAIVAVLLTVSIRFVLRRRREQGGGETSAD